MLLDAMVCGALQLGSLLIMVEIEIEMEMEIE
jgi:hypothetical protein